MPPLSHPLRFLVVAVAGWINQQQSKVIDYFKTENRVLREQLGPSRLRFADDQRIRLACRSPIWYRCDTSELRRFESWRTFWSGTWMTRFSTS